MKPLDVKSNVYINSKKENDNKDPKFKIGDTVKISKYKNIFVKALFQIGLKKFLLIQKLQKRLLVILKAKKLLEHFTKKSCKNKSK